MSVTLSRSEQVELQPVSLTQSPRNPPLPLLLPNVSTTETCGKPRSTRKRSTLIEHTLKYLYKALGNHDRSPTAFELMSLSFPALCVLGHGGEHCIVEPWGGKWLVFEHGADKRVESTACGNSMRICVSNIGQKSRYLRLCKRGFVAVRLVSLTLSAKWTATTYIWISMSR